jgi:hypothetical protein
MTNEEKLQRIRARCVELLELAEKRTPGKWKYDFDLTGFPRINNGSVGVAVTNLGCSSYIQREHDATFIASCAGPAEAGWKATIAAIDGLLELGTWFKSPTLDELQCAIIVAWPEELL